MAHLSDYIDEEGDELRGAIKVDGFWSGLVLDLYLRLIGARPYPSTLGLLRAKERCNARYSSHLAFQKYYYSYK